MALRAVQTLPRMSNHYDMDQSAYLDIFDKLRQLGIAYRTRLDYFAFISTAFALSHRLCEMVYGAIESNDEELLPDQVLILCAQSATFGFLWYFAISQNIHGKLINKLYSDFLQKPDSGSSWTQSGGDLKSLLWVLATINAAALTAELALWQTHMQLRERLIQALKVIALRLSLKISDAFRATLKVFPWAHHFYRSRYAVLWECIEGVLLRVPSASMPGQYEVDSSAHFQ